jgi:hypothetical protein
MLNVIMVDCRILYIVMLNVIMLNVIMLSVVMLSVIMLSVVMLSVVMLSVVAPVHIIHIQKSIILDNLSVFHQEHLNSFLFFATKGQC